MNVLVDDHGHEYVHVYAGKVTFFARQVALAPPVFQGFWAGFSLLIPSSPMAEVLHI